MATSRIDWEYLMPKDKILRGAGYIRVSDLKQESNYSIAFQQEKIMAYFREHGIVLKEEHIFVDTYTGKVWRQRKNLQNALSAAKRHEFDILGMYKLDRLSREPDDQIILREQFQYYGVKIVTLDPNEHADDDSLAGEIVRRVYAWKAKIERQDIIQRTQDGLEQRVKEGSLLVGRRPLYGYKWQDIIVPGNAGRERFIPKAYYVIFEEQAVIVVRIFRLAKEGVSLRKIAFQLTQDGIPTPEGKSLWRYQSVRNILTNRSYIGRAAAYKTKTQFIPGQGQRTIFRPEDEWVEIPGVCPAIIDEETFNSVQKQLVWNKLNSPRNNPAPQENLLRCGMAVCGYCGHNLSVDRGKYRGKTRVRYRCPRARKGYGECSGNPSIEGPVLEGAVWNEALAIIRDPSVLDIELEKQKTADPTKDEIAALDRLLIDVVERIKNLTETIETTTSPDARELLTLRLAELAEKKKSFEEKRDGLVREKINWLDVQQALLDFKKWCIKIRPTLDCADRQPTHEEKRNALERLGITAYVYISGHKPRVRIEKRPAELRPGLGGQLFPSAHTLE